MKGGGGGLVLGARVQRTRVPNPNKHPHSKTSRQIKFPTCVCKSRLNLSEYKIL